MKILIPLLLLSFTAFGQEANEKYCKKIITKIDKFNGDTTYISPHAAGFMDPIYFIKKNGETMISMIGSGSTLNIEKEGLIILLKDGTKIERPDMSIDWDSNPPYGWIYSVFFTLTEEEIRLLSNSPISSARMYVYDTDYHEKKSLKQMEYLKCLQNL
jgi:hypothetical protein